MSLVTEALRKARQEAAAKEAAGRGRAVSLRAARPPRGPVDARQTVAIVALVLGAGLAGAGLVWWGSSRTQPATGPTATTSRSAAPSPTGATSASRTGSGPGPSVPGTGGDHTPPLAPAPVVLTDGSRPAPSSRTGPTITGVTGTEAPAAPRADPGVEAGHPDSPSAPSPTPIERAFVLDADLGRVKLHLDFVVYKPSAPFAGINGQQVVPGSIVEGWLVEEIGRDFVRVSDGRGKVVLRTR